MTRAEEVRQLLNLTSEEVMEKAGHRLVVVKDIDQLHQHFADSIAEEISGARAAQNFCSLGQN